MTWPRAARAALTVTVVVLAVAAQVQVWSSPPAYDAGGRPLNALVAALYTLPILLASRWPLGAFTVVVGASALDVALGGHGGTQWFALLLVVYALGRYAGPRASAIALAALALLVLAVDIPRLQDGDPIDEVLPGWFILAGTWGLGRWTARRRREVVELATRAEVLARDQEESARAAVALERARIARELHDLVAHALAVVVLQAQAAQRVLDTDRSAARQALLAVERTGREGLTELRRMLDILVVDVPPEDLDPAPGLGQLDALADRVRQAGVPVTVSVVGEPRPLPAAVDLSAYRIVQEALTNVLKHAEHATAAVGIRYRSDEVELSVHDDGAGNGAGRVASDGAGRGLINMRERAHLFGGRFEAGARPQGGFAVTAVLPTRTP
jgi:signal transduction histidine kinase